MPYIVPLPVQISEMSVLENSKPFSPGHVYLNQSKAGIFPLRDLRTALTTRLRTQWDIQMVPSDLEFRYGDLEGDVFKYHLIWPSSSFWRNTDLNGASGNTITSNLPCWYLVLHSLLYCDSVAIKSAKASSYHNSIREKKKDTTRLGMWYCYSFIIVIGFWIKHVNSGCHFLVQFKTSLALTPRLFIHDLFIDLDWPSLSPQLLVSHSFIVTVSPMENKRDASVAGLGWLQLRTVEAQWHLLVQVQLVLLHIRPLPLRHLWKQDYTQ